jgi:hypothetical protein
MCSAGSGLGAIALRNMVPCRVVACRASWQLIQPNERAGVVVLIISSTLDQRSVVESHPELISLPDASTNSGFVVA